MCFGDWSKATVRVGEAFANVTWVGPHGICRAPWFHPPDARIHREFPQATRATQYSGRIQYTHVHVQTQ